MQDETLLSDTFCQTALVNELSGMGGGFIVMDFPANDLAAEDIHDQVQAEEPAHHRTGQEGYIPGPNLIGRSGTITVRFIAYAPCLGFTPVMQLIGAVRDRNSTLMPDNDPYQPSKGTIWDGDRL